MWQPKAKAPQRASAYPGDSLLSGMTNAPWRLPPRPSEAGRVIVEYSDQHLPQSHAALLPPPTTLVGAAGVTMATAGRRLHGNVRGWWHEFTSRATSQATGPTTKTAPQRSPPRLLYDEVEEGGWVCIHHPINNNNTRNDSSSRPSPSPPRHRRRASLSEEEFETVDENHLQECSPRHLQPPPAAPPGAHFRAVVARLASDLTVPRISLPEALAPTPRERILLDSSALIHHVNLAWQHKFGYRSSELVGTRMDPLQADRICAVMDISPVGEPRSPVAVFLGQVVHQPLLL